MRSTETSCRIQKNPGMKNTPVYSNCASAGLSNRKKETHKIDFNICRNFKEEQSPPPSSKPLHERGNIVTSVKTQNEKAKPVTQIYTAKRVKRQTIKITTGDEEAYRTIQ